MLLSGADIFGRSAALYRAAAASLRFGLYLLAAVFPAQGSESVHSPLVTRRAADDIRSSNGYLLEYPRPGMVRADWMDLNGPWDYSVSDRNRTDAGTLIGKILVPFPVESRLSGVGRQFTEQQRLWYRREFVVPQSWRGRQVLVHFEAVDWATEVWVNGQDFGVHRGGYDRFSFDITAALKPSGDQELVVSVLDPSETGYEPRGKQSQHTRPPFFSASSGIWQTVWLEPVPETSIESLRAIPDIDAGVLRLRVFPRSAGVSTAESSSVSNVPAGHSRSLEFSETNGDTVEAIASAEGNEIARASGRIGEPFSLSIPNVRLWSPEDPFLYDLKVILQRNGKPVDEVSSYFGMRKIAVTKDDSGFPRLMLNNRRVFELGVLDQGYWPDGIYTAPSDEAMRHDLEVTKQMGFNMVRKHVKIEPERWYYWCDKLGLLVWQDMPNGDRSPGPREREIQRRPESARQFEQELTRMIVDRGNHPSIVMWIAFNQGWGQYDTARITALIKQLDPSRLVMDASGWFDMGVGDTRSLHDYPGPSRPIHDGRRACVLGECGGLGLAVPGHLWGSVGRWNTTYYDSPEKLLDGYAGLMSKVQALEEKDGLAGAVVTELTDVETELNGFMTYDRAVIKMPVEKVREINERVINAKVEAKVATTEGQ